MSYYRTRTYIAGDFDTDKNLIDKLYEWNENDNLLLHFSDAHSLMQSKDTSLPCTIKDSLAKRLNASKTFLLIVGEHTTSVTKGSCQHCDSYSPWYKNCRKGKNIDARSYIRFECEKAIRDGLNIIVVYNYTQVKKEKCPDILRNTGDHINGYYKGYDGKYYWNYIDIKDAILKY